MFKYTKVIKENIVSILASLIIAIILFGSFLGGHQFKYFIEKTLYYVMNNTSLLLSVGMSIFLMVVILLAISPIGKLKLYGQDSQPEFSLISWLAMMFSAGMGIGMLFFGVGEPVVHYTTSTPGIDPNAKDLTQQALGLTIFHWGMHPWAVYSIVGLFIGYFLRPERTIYSLKTVLENTFDNLPYKDVIGAIVDIFTIVSIIIGVATSLGLGALQINSGLFHYFHLDKSPQVQIFIIIIVTFAATLSMLSGLSQGVKILSNINMFILFILLISIIIGFKQYDFLKSMLESSLAYFSIIFERSLPLSLIKSSPKWLGNWTIFYWAWWISWSPFVGIFLARISKGRTIRSFVFCALFAPSIISIMWFSILGNSAIDVLKSSPHLSNLISQNLTEGMFFYLDQVNNFPAFFLGILTLLSIFLFFITSSDSASLVVHSIAAGEKKAFTREKIYWACLEGLLAIILMFSGGLKTLQSFAILMSIPICIYLIFMIVPFIRILIRDYRQQGTDLNSIEKT